MTAVSDKQIGLVDALFIVFLTLKLCDVIDWSWWWVTAPLWGSMLLYCALKAIERSK